jgi:hypothetical protein
MAVTIRPYFKADLQLSLGEGFIRPMITPPSPRNNFQAGNEADLKQDFNLTEGAL